MKYFGFLAKVLLSLSLLILVLSRIEFGQVVALLFKWSTALGILVAVCALVIQSILAAYRQIEILGVFGYQIGFMQSLRVWFSGLFVTQVAVTFIAGDFIRSVQLMGEGVPRRIAGRAIALDRLIGLAVLLLMVAAIVPYVLSLSEDAHLRLSLMFLAIASVAGVVAIMAAGFLPSLFSRIPWPLVQHRLIDIAVDLAGVSRFAVAAPRRLLAIVGLSLVMHLLNVFGIVIIARSLGIGDSANVAAIAIPVMLLAMLPISFAGWGVREAAMVTGMGLLHVLPSLALATSVGFGFSMIFASLPGLFGLLHKNTKIREAVRFAQAPGNR
ncbi:MAG: glycosyltransferase 2 family protein [Bradyrhizobium sp.]|jgi:uncharacterized membrane protein YbhN (UPF0104 family)|nr:glycosyltransferase 2 family protein [Bradyrhizobium sp.]